MVHRGFENFSDAFDYCREADHPVQVVITGIGVWKLYKLFPSGKAVFIRYLKESEELMEENNVTN